VLIIGIDSAIGLALANTLVTRGDIVCGTTRRDPPISPYPTMFLDLAAPDAVRADLPAADVAVFCAAMARFAECRAAPDRAHHVNVVIPVGLGHRLLAGGSRVVLLSTSAVFDGRRPCRRPDEPTCPKSAYGWLKAEAEKEFLAPGAAASVLRLSKVLTPEMSLFTGWIAAFGQNRPVRAFTDLYFCPLSMSDAIRALLAVIDDGAGGIYHVSGSDDIAYSDAARHLARRHGGDPCLLEPGRAAASGVPAEEILRHTSLDTARLSALTGFRPQPALSVLDNVFARVATPPRRAS
jgi:dTDP-4-dehydrorhamnose reductase